MVLYRPVGQWDLGIVNGRLELGRGGRGRYCSTRDVHGGDLRGEGLFSLVRVMLAPVLGSEQQAMRVQDFSPFLTSRQPGSSGLIWSDLIPRPSPRLSLSLSSSSSASSNCAWRFPVVLWRLRRQEQRDRSPHWWPIRRCLLVIHAALTRDPLSRCRETWVRANLI